MKSIRIGLLGRIIIAIALGILFGNFLPEAMVRIFVTFNGIFSEFLGFIIPLIILGLVTPAIADIGSQAGRMLVVTTLVAYTATLISGFLSYFTGATFFPSMITPGASIDQISQAHDAVPFFTVSIPASMNVMTALVMSFTLGIGLAYLNKETLKNAFNDFKDIIVKTIQAVILPLLPVYIFGIFLHDPLGPSDGRAHRVHQDYRCDFRAPCVPARHAVCHRFALCACQSVQGVAPHVAGLFHCIGYPIISSYYPRNLAPNREERRERGHRGFCDSTLCHHPLVG